MEVKESLTRENFWNEVATNNPKGVQIFKDWIDEYKKSVNWDRLFNAGWLPVDSIGSVSLYPLRKTVAPKFHDLPYAMQLGIWMEFVAHQGGCYWKIEDFFEFDLRKEITEYLVMYNH